MLHKPKKFFTLVLTVLFGFIIFSHSIPSVFANQTATVAGTRVNIRTGPGTNYGILMTVNKNTTLNVLESSNNWHKISTSSGKVGWIAGWLVSIKNSSTNQGTESKQWVKVKVSSANIRNGPGLGYSRIASGSNGSRFEVISSQSGWYKILLADGRQAWISSTVVTLETSSPQPTNGSQSKVSVMINILNVRSGPSTSYSIVEKVSRNDLLPVIQHSGSWYKVSTPSGNTGWVADWLVKLQSDETSSNQQPNQSQVKKLIISGASAVNIRNGPSTQNQIIVTLPQGTQLDGLQLKGDWYNVRLSDGREGWIFAKYVKDVANLQPASRGGERPLAWKVIVVDPGHGKIQSGNWADPGAIGPTGLTERESTLGISLKLRDILSAFGAKAILTHTDSTDLSLTGRANVGNNNNADLFISIHTNSNTNRSYKGTSTYYYIDSSMSQSLRNSREKLAESIQNQLVSTLSTKNIGILQAPFTVIKATQMPSVLVETAFISNPEEEALLASDNFRQKIAEGISSGILNYL